MDMWEPYRLSTQHSPPNCRIVYDKFHVMQHAKKAMPEYRTQHTTSAGAGILLPLGGTGATVSRLYAYVARLR